MARVDVRVINLREAKRAFTKIAADVSPTTSGYSRELWRMIGTKLRNETRKNITSQGNGAWAPLSKWTRARTGRRKALVSERSHVKYRVLPGRLEVYYDMHRKFTLTQHHKGYKIKPQMRKVSIPLRNPGLLGNKAWTKAKKAHFVDRRTKVVPGRKVWPTEREAQKVSTRVGFDWVQRVIRRHVQFAAKGKIFK